ncbi:MAG: hypothetical protein R3C25_09945 [Hyphomonadaceae bacterium]
MSALSMRRILSVLALALLLAALPACAQLRIGDSQIDNPVAAARTLDQRAYALLNAYAAVIEEATDVVRDPATPVSVMRALARAERAATPAAETLEIAVAAYMRAQADFEAASSASQTDLERAASALTIAARRLNDAIAAAQAPIGDLEDIIRARR